MIVLAGMVFHMHVQHSKVKEVLYILSSRDNIKVDRESDKGSSEENQVFFKWDLEINSINSGKFIRDFQSHCPN